MGGKTSPPLPSPIRINLYGTEHFKEFARISDVIEWSLSQRNAWSGANPTHQHLAQPWASQKSHANNVHHMAMALDALLAKPLDERTVHENQQIAQQDQNLRQHLGHYASGQAISTDHPMFDLIQALSETDPNAASALLMSLMPNGHQLLSQSHALDAMTRVGASFATIDRARRRTIKSLRAELAALKQKAEADIETWRATIDEHSQATKDNVSEHKTSVEAREEEVRAMFTKFGEEWEELKRIYDEKLALLAPTEYWRTRSTAHRDKARNYAIAFGATIAVALVLFAWLAIGHLANPGKGSVVLVLLPVLVPAFAGIWVLRILGRLLSENLAISQDALERETMVKTFLALMRDETTGKSVVTDDDRRLILQALFRPSTVTATDDSPPINWIQAIGGKK